MTKSFTRKNRGGRTRKFKRGGRPVIYGTRADDRSVLVAEAREAEDDEAPARPPARTYKEHAKQLEGERQDRDAAAFDEVDFDDVGKTLEEINSKVTKTTPVVVKPRHEAAEAAMHEYKARPRAPGLKRTKGFADLSTLAGGTRRRGRRRGGRTRRHTHRRGGGTRRRTHRRGGRRSRSFRR